MADMGMRMIRWNRASQFGVTVEFLTQQVKYLIERNHARLKNLLKDVGRGKPPSPIAPFEAAGDVVRRRLSNAGGNGGVPRAASSLGARRESPLARVDLGGPRPQSAVAPTPPRPAASKAGAPVLGPAVGMMQAATTSTAAAAAVSSSPRLPQRQGRRLSSLGTVVGLPAQPVASSRSPTRSIPASEPASDSDSSDSSPAHSRVIRRPRKPSPIDASEGSDSETPAFLVPAPALRSSAANNRRSGTGGAQRLDDLRGGARPLSDRQTAASGSIGGVRSLSPLRPVDPVGKSQGKSALGSISDGGCSIGSSFSDVEADASVMQLALDEAYGRHIQHAGDTITNRISVLGQNLRDKYMNSKYITRTRRS